MTADLESAHRLHPYSARFPSHLAEEAIRIFTRRRESVFDPFCGSGTTPVAALSLGRAAVACDIDPLAGLLTAAKCGARAGAEYKAWTQTHLRLVESRLRRLKKNWQDGLRLRPGATAAVGGMLVAAPSFAEVDYWFPPQVIAALSAISRSAHEAPDAHLRDVAMIALSASIIAKWPVTLSYAMDVDHTRPHRRLQRISLERVREVYTKRLNRVTSCLDQLHKAYRLASPARRTPKLFLRVPHDARLPLPEVADDSQSLVVTSPPYYTAVDYPRAHRLSVCWMNGHAPAELVSRRKYIGLRQGADVDAQNWLAARPDVLKVLPESVVANVAVIGRLCAFFDDLKRVLEQAWRVLRPGRHAVFVIASNVVRGERVPSDVVLKLLAQSIGFVVVSSGAREIHRDKRRFPVGPFGFDGPMTHEHRLVFVKPKPKLMPLKPPPKPPRRRRRWGE